MKIWARKQRAFSLIELMIVIAIIGVLAAVAIPSYKDYVMKAHVSNIISTTAPFETAVSEYVITNGNGLDCSGMGYSGPPYIYSDNTNPNPSVWLVAVEDNCRINVGLKNFIINGIPYGFNLLLTPTMGSDGGISWTCNFTGSEPWRSRWAPSTCRG